MPNPIDPRLLRGRAHPGATEPALRLARVSSSARPAADADALRRRAEVGASALARADAEFPTLLRRVATDLHVAPPTALVSSSIGAPGSTVQLGLDHPGQTINTYDAHHVFRSKDGAGSYIELSAPGQLAVFDLSLPLGESAGIYLAVVHAGGGAGQLDMRGWLYPGGSFHDVANRSGDKFLVPFEITGAAYLVSLVMGIPVGQSGALEIRRVDVTKVT